MSAPAVLEGISPSALLSAMDENLWTFWRDYGRVPHAELHEEPDLRWFASGVPLAVFNGVPHARMAEDHVGTALLGTQAVADRRGVPVMWWVGPNSRPADLAVRLELHGLALARTMAGMAIDLEALDPRAANVVGLRIERVRGVDMQRLWAHCLGEGSGFGEAAVRALAELEPLLFDADYARKPRYIGFLSGRPVATSVLVPAAGLAGIYAVSTTPDARGRGIGAAMTVAPLLEARAQGCRLGILQATAMGHPVYRRLGFRNICEYRCYVQPPASSRT
jgi:GNAT superfamily N-acetyltransferase